MQRKKGQGLGAFTSLCVRKTLLRNLPIKTKGLEILQILGCPAAYFRCACIACSFPCVSIQRWERANSWPHLPWGPPQRGGACSLQPVFFGGLIPLGLNLKPQPQESTGEEGNGHCEVGKQKLSPMHAGSFQEEKHIFPWPSAQSKPITSSEAHK